MLYEMKEYCKKWEIRINEMLKTVNYLIFVFNILLYDRSFLHTINRRKA
jgi:hypothetical protein